MSLNHDDVLVLQPRLGEHGPEFLHFNSSWEPRNHDCPYSIPFLNPSYFVAREILSALQPGLPDGHEPFFDEEVVQSTGGGR